MAEEKSFKQTPLERNITILLYLKKHEGEWKNKNEIATYSQGHGLHRKRLDEILDAFEQRELVIKQEAENPQARWEFKISERGKDVLQKYISLLHDPDMKFFAGVKRDKFDESD